MLNSDLHDCHEEESLLCRSGPFGFGKKGGVDPCGCYRLTSKLSSPHLPPKTTPRKQVFRIDDMGKQVGHMDTTFPIEYRTKNDELILARAISVGGFEKESEA